MTDRVTRATSLPVHAERRARRGAPVDAPHPAARRADRDDQARELLAQAAVRPDRRRNIFDTLVRHPGLFRQVAAVRREAAERQAAARASASC